ncbi:MAG: hypothetical protein ACPL1D_01435 [Microgenomates group bacterium]
MKKNISIRKIIIFGFILTAAFLFFKDIKKSVFLKPKERVNVVFYGEKTFFYSLAKDGINYLIVFPPEIKILIPGGYGYYRLGGLGKLVSLEKKPELYKKTFSLATASMVDLYFYPCQSKVFYRATNNYNYPQLLSSFFYCSNTSTIDRIIIWFYLLQNKNKVIYLDFKTTKDNLFDDENFFKEKQGIFYKKIFRQKKKDVQIIYTKSDKTALKISRIIEGEGIKVSDIDLLDNFLIRNPTFNFKNLDFNRSCWLIENKKKPSLVAKNLISFFNCNFYFIKTNLPDAIFILGPREDDWSI